MRLAVVFGPSAIVALAIACTSAETERYDGPRSPCSTGPLYTYETQFPYHDGKPFTAPSCIVHCGQEADGPSTTTAALPSGSCNYDGELCQMVAYRERVCPSGQRSRCNHTRYMCRCESAEWRCYIAGPPGGSFCACHDGGVEATVDAASTDAAID